MLEKHRVMISMPMNGLSDEEVDAKFRLIRSKLECLGYDVVNSVYNGGMPGNVKNIPVYYLGFSILCMSQCDVVCFCKGWDDARGCRIEHEIAKQYGLDMIYEEDI